MEKDRVSPTVTTSEVAIISELNANNVVGPCNIDFKK
jgi:hypothetical protein